VLARNASRGERNLERVRFGSLDHAPTLLPTCQTRLKDSLGVDSLRYQGVGVEASTPNDSDSSEESNPATLVRFGNNPQTFLLRIRIVCHDSFAVLHQPVAHFGRSVCLSMCYRPIGDQNSVLSRRCLVACCDAATHRKSGSSTNCESASGPENTTD